MQIYFYCSYEGSQRGYFMTSLQGGELIPQDPNLLPKQVNEFFFRDRFRLLWMDLPEEGSSWLKPRVVGGFFGVRHVTGLLCGVRKGFVNVGFYATEAELPSLKRLALCALQNIDQFRAMLLGCIAVGGPYGYQINAEYFCGWLQKSMASRKMRVLAPQEAPVTKLLPAMQRTEPPTLETELLRLMVLNTSWKDVRESMGSKLLWRRQPDNVLQFGDFERIFSGRSPLWEMTEA